DERPKVSIEVRARNTGEVPLGDLALGVTAFAPAFSRSDLELALVDDPGDNTEVRGQDVPLEGTLEPGIERSFRTQISLTAPGLDRVQSYVYPLRLELLSGNTAVAILRSAVVVIVNNPPTFPLRVQTSVQLTAPPVRGPDGVFTDARLERAIAPDGRLTSAVTGLVEATGRRRPFAVDLAVAPQLLVQLQDMANGYRVADTGGVRQVVQGEGGAAEAAELLRSLEGVAPLPNVRITAPTFAGATLPSLRGALARDLEPQLAIGSGVVEQLLDVVPSERILLPRRAAIDAGSLDRVAARGAEVVLLTPLAVPPSAQANDLSPPPTATLPGGRDGVTAVVATQSLQNLVTSELAATDPVLVAQQTFAMLATVWLEQPGIADRGVSILLPESAPGPLVAGLATRISSGPFLGPLTAGELVALVPPPERPVGFVELDDRGFGPEYVDAIRGTRRRIATYRSMLDDASPLPEQLEDRVLLAEAAEFLDDPDGGLAVLGSVDARVGSEMGRITPGVSPVVTLTSRNARIPLTVANDGTESVSVVVGLESPQLEQLAAREVNELEPGETRDLVFDVRLKTTGQFPLRVVVRAPTGRPVSEATMIVRSTGYSTIALVITIGAALVLVALWVRRFFRRTKA
ncbi:MAG: DUF6049 family protein, partial [Actinomycetota bacterium]